MAQVVKLKRTAVQGKVPTTSNLELGELAINTFDGRIFFEKNDGDPSIQQIVSTDSLTSGSINISSAVTSSYVKVTNDLLVEGDATINGDLTLGGNIFIGDNPSDSVTVSAEFSGSLIPDGNDYFDLGSAANRYWRKAYINQIFTNRVEATSLTGSIAATNGVISGSTQLHSLLDDRYLNTVGENVISSSAQISAFNTFLEIGGDSVVSESSQIDHDSTLNYVANEHIDHSSITIGSGKGLEGGGTIDTNRSLSLHTGSLHFTDGVVQSLPTGTISGSTQITSVITDEYISASAEASGFGGADYLVLTNVPSGIISSSAQLLDEATDFGTGRISGDNFGDTDGGSTFTGSFSGDGSNLTNIDVAQIATVTGSFSNASSFTINHSFGTKNILVSVYSNDDEQIIPQAVTLTDDNNVSVTLSSAESGFAVVAKGGHIVNAQAGDSSNLNGQPSSFYLDYGNLNNVPSGIVSSSTQIDNLGFLKVGGDGVISSSAQLTTDFDTRYLNTNGDSVVSGSSQVYDLITDLNTFTASAVTVSGSGTSGSLSVFSDTHTIVNSPITSLTSGTTIIHSNNGNTVFTISGSNGELLSVDDDNTGNVFEVNDISGVPVFQVNNSITASTHFVPSQNVTYDLGSSTYRWRDLYLSGSTIDLGGTKITRDTDGNVEFKDASTEALKTLKVKELEIGEGDNKVKLKLDTNNKVKFEDSASGDAKAESTFYKETVTANTKHTITHNLNEDYPIVQAYNSDKVQELAEVITSVNANTVELEFSGNFAGVIVVKV